MNANESRHLDILDFRQGAADLDAALLSGQLDEHSYESALLRMAREMSKRALSQASTVGELAIEERARHEEFIRGIWGQSLDIFFSGVLVAAGAMKRHVTDSNVQVREGNRPEDPRRWPLAFLTARAVRTAYEVHHLSAGGYPKGALTRARSMYELAVTSRVLADFGAPDGASPDLADRYVKTQDIDRYRDAVEYNRHASDDEKFTDAEMDMWREEAEDAKREFGSELAKPRGWARPLFPDKQGLIQIPDLEELAGFSRQRPFYRWANHEVHATARGGVLNTYLSNAGVVVHSTERTHRGLGEPLSMAFTYLIHTVTDLLLDTGSPPATMNTLSIAFSRQMKFALDDQLLETSATADRTPYLR